LLPKVCSFVEDVILVLGNKALPQLHIFLSKLTRAWLHDIVWEYVVVAQGRHDRDHRRALIAAISEDLHHLVDGFLVEIIYLGRGTGNLDILIVPCRVTGPDDKIDLLIAPDSKSAPTCRELASRC
jgi:hypothetical protein